MVNALNYEETYVPTMLGEGEKKFHVTPISGTYLRKIGMSDEEIIEIHQALWNLTTPFKRPNKRWKLPNRRSKARINHLEQKYGLDLSQRLEGEPEPTSYNNCIDQVIAQLETKERIVICGDPASGKTTLAKRIKRLARKKGYEITILDEYQTIPEGIKSPTIRCALYIPQDGSYDLRIFLNPPVWRQIWNTIKRGTSIQSVLQVFSRNSRKLNQYQFGLQRSISDIVTSYSLGRPIFLDEPERLINKRVPPL